MNDAKPDVASLPAILRDRAKVSELRGHYHAQWSEGVRFAANQIEAALAKPASGDGLIDREMIALALEYVAGDNTVTFSTDALREQASLIRRLAAATGVQGEAAADYVPGELDRTAPARVWLQIDTSASNDERDDPWPGAEHVTWQDESIGGLEIQYVRADLATTPPPAPAAEQGERKVPVPADVMEARAQGRSEALAIILGLEAEVGLNDYVDSIAPGPAGEWGTAWNEVKLRELLRADDTAWSLLQEAEAEYWHNLGLREEAQAQSAHRATQPEARGMEGMALDDLARRMAQFPMLAVIRALEKVVPGIRGAFAPPQAAPEPVRVDDAIREVREAELFEDGLSGDLLAAGVNTIADAYMRGRLDACDELTAALATGGGKGE